MQSTVVPKVSVIVPIYNAQKTLRRCLDSLVKQTLKEIEFILVNDASTDHSCDILLQYERDFGDRMVVMHTAVNSGAGGARNLGLQHVRGEYIGFVDADDYVKEDFFECLYNKAISKGYDVVDSPFYIQSKNKVDGPIGDALCDCCLSTEQRDVLVMHPGYIWSKLFKAEFLKKNDIHFRPHVKLEDVDFLLKVVLRVELLGNIHDPKYIYDDVGTETWSVRVASMDEYKNMLLLIEEYGKVLRADRRAQECEAAVRAAVLHFYRVGIECCLNCAKGEMGEEELHALIKLRDVKNLIFKDGYDNPYFRKEAGDDVGGLMRWIDTLSI